MQSVREAWTDQRLDDLSARMDRGFDRVDADIRDLRSEMNARFDAMNARFDRMEARFDAMQRTMLLGFVTMTTAIVASVISTQL